jgi:uncharacterized protein (DUF1800 family)
MEISTSFDLKEQFYKENIDFEKIKSIAKRSRTITSGLDPYKGPFETQQKKHLLNRVLCGYASRHLKDLEGKNLKEALEVIFSPEAFPANPVNDYYYEISKEEIEAQGHFYVEPGKEFHLVPEPNNAPWPTYESLFAWIHKALASQNTSIHWKMVYFLHNLTGVKNPILGAKIFYQHYKTLFYSVFSSYKKFIIDITLDPMMLDFLNLQISKKSKPDDNYARELQELFTVGKGPNSKFTENDVVEMSKVLVGWQFSWESRDTFGEVKTIFNSWNHDTTDKKFSEFYGNRVIRGREGEAGKEELYELIDMIFATNECALYLCRRLYQFFCYPVIDENTEKNVIVPMSKLLRENNYNLMVPLKTFLGSEHFFDIEFHNSMIKSPIEFVFPFFKEFDLLTVNNLNPTDIPKKFTDSRTRDFYNYRRLEWQMGEMGLRYSEPPSVSGWPAYYQVPVYDLFWINSTTISKRAAFVNALSNWGIHLGKGEPMGWVDTPINYEIFINKLKNPEDVDSFLNECIDRFLSVPLDSKTREKLKQTLLEGRAASYFTDLVKAYKANPTQNNLNPLKVRVQKFFSTLLQLGEVQLF